MTPPVNKTKKSFQTQLRHTKNKTHMGKLGLIQKKADNLYKVRVTVSRCVLRQTAGRHKSSPHTHTRRTRHKTRTQQSPHTQQLSTTFALLYLREFKDGTRAAVACEELEGGLRVQRTSVLVQKVVHFALQVHPLL